MFKKMCLLVLLSGMAAPALAQDTGWFTETTDEVGLTGLPGFRIVALDVNGDDYPDMLTWNDHAATDFMNISLYLNTADPQTGIRTFVDASADAGLNANADPLKTGRMSDMFELADLDNDGDPDLVSCVFWQRWENFVDRGDRCEVLLNDGAGHFTLKEGAGLRELGLVPVSGISFLDYDLDGNIDMYLATFLQDNTNNIGRHDVLMKGHGDGTFEDVTEAMGIADGSNMNPKFGVNMVDLNNDGWADIATSPYCRMEGNLWVNAAGSGFVDMATDLNYSASHGLYREDNNIPLRCQWAANPWDYDNDGDMDLVQLLVHGGIRTGVGRTFIARNTGEAGGYALEGLPDYGTDLIIRDQPRPTHLGDYYGVWFDMDNNGWVDLAITQGTYEPGTDRLFMQVQDDNHVLQDVTSELGLLDIKDPHAFVSFDYDLDGDEDFALGRQQEGMRMQFFRNDIGSLNHWVAVRLVPPAGVNGSAVGARVVVKTALFTQTRDVYAGEGNFVGERPFALNFGLGEQTAVESITVTWPNAAHTQTVLTNPAVDQLITVDGNALPPCKDSCVHVEKKGCSCSSTTHPTGEGLLFFGLLFAAGALVALRRQVSRR